MCKKMTRVIVCAGGKGGTGKTTTSINLSAALNYFGKRVTIIDANLTTPNVGLHLGVPIVPVTLHDVLKGRSDISEAVYLHKSGTRVVPASIALNDLKRLDITKLDKAIKKLVGSCDVIVVDAAAGLGKEALSALKAADEVLIVTNPEIPAVTDALKTIKLCEEIKKPVIGVIINKTNVLNADMALKDIELILEHPIIGVIPEDRSVKFALVQKDAVVHTHPKSIASIQYKKLAAELFNIDYNESFSEKRGFFGTIKGWFGK